MWKAHYYCFSAVYNYYCNCNVLRLIVYVTPSLFALSEGNYSDMIKDRSILEDQVSDDEDLLAENSKQSKSRGGTIVSLILSCLTCVVFYRNII